MKQQLITKYVWKATIRRYQITAAIGLAMCIFFFWRLYYLPTEALPPLWMLWGTGLSGLVLLGGLFGLGLSYFLHALHK